MLYGIYIVFNGYPLKLGHDSRVRIAYILVARYGMHNGCLVLNELSFNYTIKQAFLGEKSVFLLRWLILLPFNPLCTF